MKIHQIICEWNSPEEDEARAWLKKFLKSRGYKFMGEGQDAMVYRNSRGLVLKVYGLNQSQSLRKQLGFYRAAKGYNSPFVPRFGEAKNIKVKGVTYTIIPTEQLSPRPLDPCMLATLDTFKWVGGDDDENRPAIDVLEDALRRFEGDKKRQLQVREIRSAIKCLKRVGVNTLDGYLIADHHFGGDDLDFPENTMWRGNTPVINDPYSN